MPPTFRPQNNELPNAQSAKLRHLRQVSNLWDNYLGIPGTRFRVGLESLVGLLPFGGDAIGIILSSYIVLQALQFRLSKQVLTRMIFNIILDGLAGSVPILGDLFDTTWKANTRNVNLLEEYLSTPKSSQLVNRWFLLLLFGGLFLALVTLAVMGALSFTCSFEH